MNRSRRVETKKKGRDDEMTLLGQVLWGITMAGEETTENKNNLGLLIHITTVVFGSITSKSDDMIY